ncbi:MAG: hypothetical protein SVG88_11270 [Halobacteriales archaeon]|nr:hypothetical protein [Halobacteriales archaeon]
MSLYEQVADLTVRIEDYSLEAREAETADGGTRKTTVIAVSGDGETGRGEDVTYTPEAHDALVAAGSPVSATGEFAFETIAAHIGETELFPDYDLERQSFRHYRRWGYESAILDLALRQHGRSFPALFDRTYQPLRFINSMRFDEEPSMAPIERWLDIDPAMEFKLDTSPAWDRSFVRSLAATDCVRVADLKGQYEGTTVDQPADPELYRLIAQELPNALIEDPKFTAQTEPILDDVLDRVTWDAPIEHVDDIKSLPTLPEAINIKPSRFGSVKGVLDAIEFCHERNIQPYSGGQTELDVGREQIQALAATFYPDAPNDAAPSVYNDPDPPADIPTSPLEPPVDTVGFRFPQE